MDHILPHGIIFCNAGFALVTEYQITNKRSGES